MKINIYIKLFLVCIITLILIPVPHNVKAITAGVSIEPILITGNCGTPNYYIKFQNIPEEQLKNIKVTIEDNTIADIELNQTLKAIIIKQKKVGKTTITAKLNYKGKTYSDTENIETIDPADRYHTIIKGSNNVKAGETTQLTLEYNICTTAYSKVSSGPNLSWTSSKPSIATINSAGQVTGISAGTTTITATYKIDNEITKKTTYTIVVSPSDTPSTPNNNQNTNNNINNNENTNISTNNNSNTIENSNQQEETTEEHNISNENSETTLNKDNKKPQDNPTTFERIKEELKEYNLLIKIIGILLLICLILKIIQPSIKSTNK